MKYKFLFLLLIPFIYATSCDNGTDPVEPFDYASQATIDNDSLVQYMQNHFVNANGELEEISNNETPVYSLVTLQTVVKHWDDIDEDVSYKLYYLELEEGVNESPSKVDSVHISYKGMTLDDEVFEQVNYGNWFMLNRVVDGWKEGVPHFKSGNYTVLPDQSFEFTDTGKGILFTPSGLGYANITHGDIPANSPLIFYIQLNLVKRTDLDLDTILSMYEDVNNDGDFSNDDTDGDEIPNYADSDDDGDGTLTKDENPDPNGDGNPVDAIDTDGDNTPDYLDTDNS